MSIRHYEDMEGIAMHIVVRLIVTALLLSLANVSNARDIGEVSTTFKLIGSDHKIVILGFEDPTVSGATCFLSRAKTGGISGAVGLATDTSDASVACRQTGPFSFKGPIAKQEEVFSVNTSILFKTMKIIRFYDAASNSLIYLVYSDKLIDGSPKNSISAVWLGEARPTLK